MPNPSRIALAATLLVAAASHAARADQLQTLRDENRALRARVQALEAENAQLRAGAASPLAAAIEAQAAEEVHVEGEGGSAVVTTEPSRLATSSGPHSRHWIWLRARPAAPDPVDLVIDASASGSAYRSVDALELDVDGTGERLPVVRRTAESHTPTRGTPGTGTASETVTVALSRAVLTRLAHAHAASGTLGPTRFELSPQQLAACRAFAERLGGAAAR